MNELDGQSTPIRSESQEKEKKVNEVEFSERKPIVFLLNTI